MEYGLLSQAQFGNPTRTHTALSVSKFWLAYTFFYLKCPVPMCSLIRKRRRILQDAHLSNESLPLQKTLLRISCIALTKDPPIFGVSSQLPLSL